MVDYFDISSWQEQEWYSTGGTRNKAVFQNPEDDSLYYFKTSLKKQNKDYKYEFWSEVIASEIGNYFGFDVLKYNVAYNGSELGCISKLMIKSDESLVEGYRYLTRCNSTYSYTDKNSYTFQFIIQALKVCKLEEWINEIIKIIIFDSIIGNSDRHQENWGFIESPTVTQPKSDFFKLKSKKEIISTPIRFSPIYDSGSCLGREIVDVKIQQFLTDDELIQSYINKGKSEIHWLGNKINHFELIRNVKIEYEAVVNEQVQRIRQIFNPDRIRDIVMTIDNRIPSVFNNQKIPDERKNLIVKLIVLRCKQLISIK